MIKGFWANLRRPIIALSPMDGVTDAAFRYIIDRFSDVDLLFTEFTSVEGINVGATKLLDAFIYHESETPTIAQIFGHDLQAFYKAVFVIAEMGFDGIDINMGCPDPNVAKKGGGAALIREPKHAQQIIFTVKQAAHDWAEGKTIESVDLKPQVLEYIKKFKEISGIEPKRSELPVSVKTRIGFDEIVTEDWIKNLLEAEPVNISLHGRTLRQLYSGQANWEEIAKAAKIAHQTETTLIGNGDVKTLQQACEYVTLYKTDGVLIGRSAIGNPWVFKNDEPTALERLEVAVTHCKKFEEILPTGHFVSLRKHLAWYAKGFEGAPEVRMKLLRSNNAAEVESIIQETKEKLKNAIIL